MSPTSKKKTTTKKATKKKVSKKKVTKKAANTKKASTKKTTKKSTKSTKPDASLIEISPEERWKMIAVAAYHKAEKRDFAPGNELQDWTEAEKEIDTLLFG
jgi:hypothetical protein